MLNKLSNRPASIAPKQTFQSSSRIDKIPGRTLISAAPKNPTTRWRLPSAFPGQTKSVTTRFSLTQSVHYYIFLLEKSLVQGNFSFPLSPSLTTAGTQPVTVSRPFLRSSEVKRSRLYVYRLWPIFLLFLRLGSHVCIYPIGPLSFRNALLWYLRHDYRSRASASAVHEFGYEA